MIQLEAFDHEQRASTTSPSSLLRTVRIDERDSDVRGLSLPTPRVHIVVRFGPAIRGVEVHALGVRQQIRRKIVRAGQRTIVAGLRLGAAVDALGVSAAALGQHVVSIEALWGSSAAARLTDQLAAAATTTAAARILQDAVAARVRSPTLSTAALLVRRTTQLLREHSVTDVAALVGVSDRHLRRTFVDVVGVGPKQVAQLQRFRRAVRLARAAPHEQWAATAVDAGYYDHSHLIAAFRQFAGTTPTALLAELRASHLLG